MLYHITYDLLTIENLFLLTWRLYKVVGFFVRKSLRVGLGAKSSNAMLRI